MGDIVLAGATSGTITLQPTAVAGSSTLTLPAANATVLTSVSAQSAFPPNIAGNGPAFWVYLNGNQSGLTSGTWTKVAFNAEQFDTANCFDSTTNYRFTPNVAGYYQLNATIDQSGTNLYYAIPGLYKNGVSALNGSFISSQAGEYSGTISALIYLNGSTDYVEMYALGYVTSGTVQINGSAATQTNFSGFLARAA